MGKRLTKAEAKERQDLLIQGLMIILPIVNYLWFEEVMERLREKGVALDEGEVLEALNVMERRQRAKHKEGTARKGTLWKRI